MAGLLPGWMQATVHRLTGWHALACVLKGPPALLSTLPPAALLCALQESVRLHVMTIEVHGITAQDTPAVARR